MTRECFDQEGNEAVVTKGCNLPHKLGLISASTSRRVKQRGIRDLITWAFLHAIHIVIMRGSI